MTVLGFDAVTQGYSRMQCVSESTIGILLAVSAVFGIGGSIAFPFLRRRLGLDMTGLVGMTLLVASLTPSVVSIGLPGSPFDPFNRTAGSAVDDTRSDCGEAETTDFISVGVFLTGIIAARFGLWVSDLAVTQIFQENVARDKRGVVGGVQGSINDSMNLVKFCLLYTSPSPRD